MIDFLVCFLAAVAWSWPYPRLLDVTLRDPYDGEAQTWVLSWVRHALKTNPIEIFQANILAPARDVLAFTEPLIGYGVLSLPFSFFGLSPAGCVNAVCLLMLALVPFGISRLARTLGVPRVPALIGGCAAAFAPLSAANLGFVYFSAWGGIALILVLTERFLRSRTVRSGLWLGAGIGLIAWFSLQLFAFTVAAVAVHLALGLVLEPRFRREPGSLLRVLPGVLLACLLVSPLGLTLWKVRQREGFTRDEAETRKYSATLSSWVTSTAVQPAHRFLKTTTSESALYPGSATLLLGLLALVLARKRAPHVRVALCGLGLGLFGLLASLGPNGPVYPALVTLAPPLFGGIRSAFRFGYVAETGFGLLAAAGAWALVSRVDPSRKRPRLASSLFAGLALVVFADGFQRYPFDHRPPREPSATDRLLASLEPGGPILFVPMTNRPGETRLMLRSGFWGFRPLVNGNISYIPERHRALAADLAKEEIGLPVLETLESWPVGLVVCEEAAIPLRQRSPLIRFLSEGLESGRFEGPEMAREAGERVFVFGVRKIRRAAGLSGLLEGGKSEFQKMASETPARLGEDDPGLPASIDEPTEGLAVRGALRVRGWAQTEAGPAGVIDIRIQGRRRTPVSERRMPRPDVAAALPHLGDPSRAGYEVVLPRYPEDAGPAFVDVTFQAADGRIRTLRTSIRWVD